jgi:membrane associated rhomboid family serine protease
MLIILSSFSNIAEGKIPLTLVLIFLFYVTTELKDGLIHGNKKVYHDGHLLGALCGIGFGFLLLYYPNIFTNLLNYVIK